MFGTGYRQHGMIKRLKWRITLLVQKMDVDRFVEFPGVPYCGNVASMDIVQRSMVHGPTFAPFG
jgi:hypothetical protein